MTGSSSPFLREFGQVAAKRAQRRRLDILLSPALASPRAAPAPLPAG